VRTLRPSRKETSGSETPSCAESASLTSSAISESRPRFCSGSCTSRSALSLPSALATVRSSSSSTCSGPRTAGLSAVAVVDAVVDGRWAGDDTDADTAPDSARSSRSRSARRR
jgi:hypothetical protein